MYSTSRGTKQCDNLPPHWLTIEGAKSWGCILKHEALNFEVYCLWSDNLNNNFFGGLLLFLGFTSFNVKAIVYVDKLTQNANLVLRDCSMALGREQGCQTLSVAQLMPQMYPYLTLETSESKNNK